MTRQALKAELQTTSMTKTCEVTSRPSDDRAGEPCGDDATHLFEAPWATRLVCDAHARQYAIEGRMVWPLDAEGRAIRPDYLEQNRKNFEQAIGAADMDEPKKGSDPYPESNRLFVPWSEDQVESLRKYQAAGYAHPYTGEGGEILTPSRDGWRHKGGGLVQFWALKCHTDWSWVNPGRELDRAARAARAADDTGQPSGATWPVQPTPIRMTEEPSSPSRPPLRQALADVAVALLDLAKDKVVAWRK